MTRRAAAPTRQQDDNLWSVFREKEDQTELLVYRVGLAMAAFGFALPVLGSLIVRRSEANLGFFAIAGSYTAWFAVAVFLRKRDRALGLVRGVSVLAYALLPWLIMGAYVPLVGMTRANGVWEPIIFYTGMAAVSVLWGRPAVPFMIAVVGALSYVLIWLYTTPPTSWSALPDNSALVPGIVAYRTGLLLFVGSLCWWGARRFRNAVLSGARALRARDLFGKYRLHDELGHGGMGSVVKATYCPEGGFERPVAIKRVLENVASEPEVVDQFRAEAELGSRLVHPNIVAVLDFGRVDDQYFFAMEYVDGPTLKEVLARSREAGFALPSRFVARVGLEICQALQFAHSQAVDGEGRPLRVVHRDLCPSNVLIARAGTVKLTDFGIARVLGDAEADMTQTVIGKIAYMAPELLTSERFDTRADIFSFGVIMWEMLTGQRLFRRSRHKAAALAVAEENVPVPTEVRPEIDPAWDAIVERCLQPEAEDRYAQVDDLRDALLALLRDDLSADGHEVRDTLGELERAAGHPWVGMEADSERFDSRPGASITTRTGTAAVRTEMTDDVSTARWDAVPDGPHRER